jgi:DnaJ-domain-containing protein 1
MTDPVVDGLDPAGVAVFIAVICGITALSCGRPEHWGFRRLTFGAGVCSAALAALQLFPSTWWFSGMLWGGYQMYLGWCYVARRRRTSHERLEYLESSARVLAYIALADSTVDPRETIIIRETYARAGFSPADLHEVDRVVQQCERQFFADGSDPDRLFVLLRTACAAVMQHSNEQTRLSFLRTAIIIAGSDGFVSSGEERALRATAHWLDISNQDYEHLWRSVLGVGPDETGSTDGSASHEAQGADHAEPAVPPDLASYYASILGVPLTASPQEVKQAYRTRAKQYHPDVVAHRGPTFERQAEEQFKELSSCPWYKSPALTS